MKLLYYALLLLSASCGGGLGPRDESAAPGATLPQLQHLSGAWQATSDTYELLRLQGYSPPASLPLTLAPDSTFTFAGLPDYLPLPSGQRGAGKLLSVVGRWQVRRNESHWEVLFHFKEGKLYPNGLTTNYGIAVVDSAYQLYTYIGDPDQGLVLTWTKPYHN